MEKPQLINFIAKIMEESGFKVYKNFKTSQKVLDIYAILPTTIGDFGVVVACKNYDKTFDVGIDVLKEMEQIGETLKASKVAIVTSSYFTEQASNYAIRKNIKLVDRNNLLEMANKYSSKTLTSAQSTLDSNFDNQEYVEEENLGSEYVDYEYDVDDLTYLQSRENNPLVYENTLYKQQPKTQRRSLFPSNSNRPSYNRMNTLDNYSRRNPRVRSQSTFLPTILKLLKNPFVTVLLVIMVSYGLSFVLGNVLKLGTGTAGLVELVTALILSYGLAFYAEQDRYFIVKGTVIFFVSLIILIILIFI